MRNVSGYAPPWSQSNPKGAAHERSGNSFRGGVSPRFTRRPKGQSAVEYVLIVAIIVLVVLIAGPWVSSAIRNQFNMVAGVLGNGTAGGTWEPSGSGSGNDTGSATVQAAIAKDTKDWTLDEQEAVAKDIAKNGTSSIAYAKAKAAMDADTKFSMKLTDGKTLEYRIIGINHDDLADGSGKAGLTFLTISHGIYSRMNATNSNTDGWEKSELRAKMNSGEIWNLMPSDFQSKVKSVRKLTNNVGGNDENCAVTATSDRLFLLSYSEIVETPYSGWSGYSWIDKEGSQYELFCNTVKENFSSNSIIAIGESWWERSTTPRYSTRFCNVNGTGDPSGNYDPTQSFCVCPAWCF